MCEDCFVSDSPWLLAMKAKEDDLVEQIEKFKFLTVKPPKRGLGNYKEKAHEKKKKTPEEN